MPIYMHCQKRSPLQEQMDKWSATTFESSRLSTHTISKTPIKEAIANAAKTEGARSEV